MPKLPVLSGDDLIRALTNDGFKKVRQKGSHVSMSKGGFRTVIPLHKDLSPGALLGILHQAGLTRDDLLRLLEH